ncbi:Arginase [Komagataella phaffii CBS 7435]|uniref:Arginase n=2 Tax=Komagataella phaffii TaxID=460519 RepID=C4R298_KOMPG|nr:Arginase, responsible for arginine degradation [Komagataella phaffii GS115]AOA61867.1 GQ67_01041T0 [Komagataella phaffii]CAH2447827.1 Arginase [Komagataella phaffii CBS 7435]AOA66972.1 GQ68_00348T0 [Komagataella phaffii GS115]CAY69622.1 Arginase, responsible for arginine degradation [Komagataella phaffii GS115]CCA37997.1 Arginase [Komagataella phaffii CBS 7435]
METQVNYNFYPNKEVTIISAPFSAGQRNGGVEKGPKYLLKHGLKEDLEALGWKVSLEEPLKDSGLDLPPSEISQEIFEAGNSRMRNPTIVGQATEKIFETVKSVAHKKVFPLTIGGDHAIGMSTLAGFLDAYPDACVLWIDAHADINTPDTSPSGNLHGFPVSFAMGLKRDLWHKQFDWLDNARTKLLANRIAYIGLRDVDAGEKVILRELGIAAYSMYHVDKYGIAKVVEMALSKINPSGKSPVHISYDVDALDPLFTPATGTPVRGGLTFREGMYIVEAVAETGNLAALDIVECNPDLAISNVHEFDTIAAGCAIAKSALGETLV